MPYFVSTHSRPKAAVHIFKSPVIFVRFQHTAARRRLGVRFRLRLCVITMFQHTAARRRLGRHRPFCSLYPKFQHTAARRRLAARFHGHHLILLCFNTQPPEGGWVTAQVLQPDNRYVSTHSRPKAAGLRPWCAIGPIAMFQHTAARRRLV